MVKYCSEEGYRYNWLTRCMATLNKTRTGRLIASFFYADPVFRGSKWEQAGGRAIYMCVCVSPRCYFAAAATVLLVSGIFSYRSKFALRVFGV